MRNGKHPLSEFELIDWIRRTTPETHRLGLGIGDDSAILRCGTSGRYLVTTDMLLEGVHFEEGTPAWRIGWKAAARSLSDVAAMGCRATAVTVCVVFHRGNDPRLAKGLFRGVRALLRRFQVYLVGGDISSWTGPLALNVTALGDVGARPPILRSGARVGDAVFVSGHLGGSILGHHLRFTPRLELGLFLNRHFRIHSMIDISDGLAADLNHILEESGVGAALDERLIPVSRDAVRQTRISGRPPIEHALFDGEDYELLFTVHPREARKIERSRPPVPVTRIGEVTSRGLRLVTRDGQERDLPPQGYVHSIS